ncbi:MAG: nitroreductase family protein [Spirochaetia bacterium]
MDVIEAIQKRHSYRGTFHDEPPNRADLQNIVECGIRAPSGCNAQTTSFIIVTNREKIKNIGDVTQYPFVQNAPALIVCAVNKEPVYHDMSFEKEDCAAAVENMLLAITALGYASVWVDGAIRREGRNKKIGRILNIPENLNVQVILPVGKPTEEKQQKSKKDFSERAFWEEYQTTP